MKPLRGLLVALAVCAVALVAPAGAAADTIVVAVPGQVTVVGDSADHRFSITDSQYELANRDWQLDAAPPEFDFGALLASSTSKQLSANQSRVTSDPSAPDAANNDPFADVLPPLGAVIINYPSLPPPARARLKDLEENLTRAKTVYDQMVEMKATSAKAIAEVTGNDIERAREIRSIRSVFDGQWTAAKSYMKLLEIEAAGLRNELEALLGNNVPLLAKDAALRAADRLIRQFPRFGELGSVTIGMLSYIGQIAAFADGVGSLAGMFSDRRVVIRDETGHAVYPVWPCRRVLREEDGTQVPNAVACPAPRFPDVFGPLSGFERISGLYVKGGDRVDRVNVGLDPETNPFSEVFVEGGGGDDVLSGSYFSERFIGGPGNDTIYGKGGDDTIYGDNLFTNIGVQSSNAHDLLFGGGGSDSIQGELGHDRIFGGAGDDNGWYGLSGGEGNDVIVPGPGRDTANAGRGRDSIFAKESDFPRRVSGTGKQADEIDDLVDCGPDAATVKQFSTISPGRGSDGSSESASRCVVTPRTPPSINQILRSDPASGQWEWFL